MTHEVSTCERQMLRRRLIAFLNEFRPSYEKENDHVEIVDSWLRQLDTKGTNYFLHYLSVEEDDLLTKLRSYRERLHTLKRQLRQASSLYNSTKHSLHELQTLHDLVTIYDSPSE